MSADAVAHVFRYSPYSGATFAVHLAVADSVNDQHNNRFWLSLRKLSRKARISRRSSQTALAALVAGGWLEMLVAGRGDTNEYRFLFHDDRAVVYDGREMGVQNLHTPIDPAQLTARGGANGRAEGVQTLHPNPRTDNPKETQDFARFWAAYPLHKAKAAAVRAWPKALKLAAGDVDRIVTGAERYAAECKEHGIILAYPASWLNAARWDDEPLPARPAKVNGFQPPPHVSIPAAQRRAEDERLKAERRRLVERLAVD